MCGLIIVNCVWMVGRAHACEYVSLFVCSILVCVYVCLYVRTCSDDESGDDVLREVDGFNFEAVRQQLQSQLLTRASISDLVGFDPLAG